MEEICVEGVIGFIPWATHSAFVSQLWKTVVVPSVALLRFEWLDLILEGLLLSQVLELVVLSPIDSAIFCLILSKLGSMFGSKIPIRILIQIVISEPLGNATEL